MELAPKEKAKELVDFFRILLMQEDTDCGNEILCTAIAKKCSLKVVDEILDNFGLVCNGQTFYTEHRAFDYYSEVKYELNKSE